MSPTSLTAEEIISARPADLFKDEASARASFHALAKKWHPDHSSHPLAAAAFAAINVKYSQAREAFKRGGYFNTLTIKTSAGEATYPYLSVRPFELGEVYICPAHVIWATRREYDDLAKAWLASVKTYKFPNEEVESKIRPYIPANSHTVANGDRAYTIVDRKRKYLRVADIVSAIGSLNPRHAAWILTRAYNLAGFLRYAKIAHLDISPETFFVDPPSHHGALLGGWFYSAPAGEKPLAAPARTAHLAATNSTTGLDAQIRLMGRRILGASSPAQLRANAEVPKPMRDWLLGQPLDNIAQAHDTWRNKVLIDSYGKHSFTVFDVTEESIYPS